MTGYNEILGGRIPIRAWTTGVEVDPGAEQQLRVLSTLPIIEGIAVMPDVHVGKGATIGSVIATSGALVPAAVGVDIGCGMIAAQTNITAAQLPDNLKSLRLAIEAAVPVGKASHKDDIPKEVERQWRQKGLKDGLAWLEDKYAGIIGSSSPQSQIGTLGGGNHFIELCLDETDRVWIMLHSGSRNIGNRIGNHFIVAAQKRCALDGIGLADKNLAYFTDDTPEFGDYVTAVRWAQDYAAANRDAMLEAVATALHKQISNLLVLASAVNCHHNYVNRETHGGREVWITRKGAVSAQAGQLGIIPGSMGTRSYIVRGKGNPDAYHSCSHGAGRRFSRGEAKRRITLDDHIEATAHVECRKDNGVIDESPAAYKSIDDVMRAQDDLVEIVHTLHGVLCVKG